MPTSIRDIGWKSMISVGSMISDFNQWYASEHQWCRMKINDFWENQWYPTLINDMLTSIHDIGWRSMISERTNDIRLKSMICQRASMIPDENQWFPRESMISDLNQWYANEHPWYWMKTYDFYMPNFPNTRKIYFKYLQSIFQIRATYLSDNCKYIPKF